MLTVLAWIVLIPAVIWNLILGFIVVATADRHDWRNLDNWRVLGISLAALMIPSLYLFGWR